VQGLFIYVLEDSVLPGKKKEYKTASKGKIPFAVSFIFSHRRETLCVFLSICSD
jgi:hypothetical protein